MVCKGREVPYPNFGRSGAVIFGSLGVQCGRVKVVYFTPQLYSGDRAELLVHTASGIVYLGHLYAGESGEFPPLNWVWCGTVPVSSYLQECGLTINRTRPHLTAPDHLEHHTGLHRTIWSIFRITNDPCSSISTLLAKLQFVPYIMLHLFTLYYFMDSWLCVVACSKCFWLSMSILFFVSY